MMRRSCTLLIVLLALAPAAGCRPTGFCESDDQCSDGLVCGPEGRCVPPGGDGDGGDGDGGADGGPHGGRPDGGPKPTGAHLLSLRFGQKDTEGSRVAADRDNNILLLGSFTGPPLDVGGGPLMSVQGSARFVAKFAPDGKHLWSKVLGTGPIGYSVLASDGTNVLVAGRFTGTANLGGADLVAPDTYYSIFLVKLGPDGGHLWSTRIGGPGNSAAVGVGVDPSGAVLLLVRFDGTIDRGLPGGATIGARSGQTDPFVVKFSPTGGPLWYRRPVSASGSIEATGLAVDRGGAAFLVGSFEQPLDFGGGALRSAGRQDTFLVKFSTAGDHLFSKSFGGSENDNGDGVAADPFGDVVIAGRSASPMASFGGAPLSALGGYVARYTGAGAHVWSRALVSGGSFAVSSVAADLFGSTVLGGSFDRSIDLGGGHLASAGLYDVYAVKYDLSGAHLWSRTFSAAGQQVLYGGAMDPAGNSLFAGAFEYPVDFGGGERKPLGTRDAFLVKLAP